MKRWLGIVLGILLLVSPALAADRPHEVIFGASLTDFEEVRTYDFDLLMTVPTGRFFAFGPVVSFAKLDPDDNEDALTVYSLGGHMTFDLNEGANGPFIRVLGERVFDDAEAWLVTPELGLKLGGDGAVVELAIARPYELDEEEDNLVSLDRTEVRARIGLRW